MEIVNLKEIASKIIISGHRGGRLEYENSMSAFRLAIDNKIPEIEFDLYLTADNNIVVLHGSEIGEIGYENIETNIFKNSMVETLTLDQIRSLTLPNGDKIPTFGEVLAVWKNQIKLSLDIKATNKDVCQMIVNLLKEHDISGDMVNFWSFNHSILQELKNIEPNISWGYLYEYYDKMDSDYYSKNGDTCNIPITYLTQELVDNWKRNNMGVVVYFPSICQEDPSHWEQCILMGVQTIISDHPLELMNYISAL